MTVALAVFVAVLALVLAPYGLLVVRVERREQRRMRQRMDTGTGPAGARRLDLFREVERLSSVRPLDWALRRCRALVDPLGRMVRQSGLRVTVGRLLLAAGCAMLLTFLLLTHVTAEPLLGLAAALPAGAVPFMVVRRACTVRRRALEEQFPEALDLIARALRAGHALTTGISMAADELPAPAGVEFRTLYDEQNFGLSLTDALHGFAARVPLLDARFFVTAVLTQRASGGNLADILDNLATVIRERCRVLRQVRVMSTHGRITGWVLVGLVPALALLFSVISPGHMQTLFSDPLGVRMIVVAIALQVMGTLVIRRIVDIEY